MKSFKLTIAYDGTAYSGWQEQPSLATLEGLIKKRIHHIFKKEFFFTGASRTDAGVHALGQVATCRVDLAIDADTFKRALNNILPQDVLVRSVEESSLEFHPRRNVAEKCYYYHFFTERPTPFISRYGVYMKNLTIPLLEASLESFIGTHDFRSFCTGDQGRTTIRTINAIELHYLRRWGIYQVRISGPSFLRHMVRRLIGASFHVAQVGMSTHEALTYLARVRDLKDPKHSFFVASPQGLLLHTIRYI